MLFLRRFHIEFHVRAVRFRNNAAVTLPPAAAHANTRLELQEGRNDEPDRNQTDKAPDKPVTAHSALL